VEEGIFFKANINEHGFQAMLDILDAPFENGAHDGARAGSFQSVLLDGPVFDESDAVFELLAVDDEACACLDVFFSGDKFFDALNKS